MLRMSGRRPFDRWTADRHHNRRRTALVALAVVAVIAWAGGATAQPLDSGHVDEVEGKPRLIVLTDVGNEPDDQMSFVRLLVYANEFDLEGLVATTSTWQRDEVRPEILRELIRAYGEVRPNLQAHATGWPSADELDALVVTGQPGYGMAAVGSDAMSPGAEAIVRAADRTDPRPLWIAVWGGANTLAQALMYVRDTRSSDEVARFVRTLRVYSISDQDDAGPWIRREFPGVRYVAHPSSPNGEEYYYATWTGISGDEYYRNSEGANTALVTNAWLDGHVRGKGPLGALYPEFAFIMEGDTPSFLGLIRNGLASHQHPGWGGWGGRYVFRQPYGETRPFWTQGGDLFDRVTSQDRVEGVDGGTYVSDQATIWRWRQAYQHDFAARMDWTVRSFAEANHNPTVTVNESGGTAPLRIEAAVGEPVVLDARGSDDPDGESLRYRWFHYPEAGYVPGQRMAAVEVEQPDQARAVVTPTAACRPNWFAVGAACEGGVAHVILAVTDNGTPPLTTYRRVILHVRPE